MEMTFEHATDEQLYIIATEEDCSIDLKYEVCREIQLRQWHEEYITDLVRLWGQGMNTYDIAAYLGTERQKVKWQLQKHGLYKKRVKRNESSQVI